MTLNLKEAVSELAPLIKKSYLVPLVGSGMSAAAPSNLPDWDTFVLKFIDLSAGLADYYEQFVTAHEPQIKKELDEFRINIDDAKKQLKTQPLRSLSVLKAHITNLQELTLATSQDFIGDWFTDLFGSAVPNDNHRHIVHTAYPFLLTTNYDRLLEQAANNDGLQIAKLSFGLADGHAAATALFRREPCIIHLHGKFNDLHIAPHGASSRLRMENIVLTAQDYTALRREYADFAIVLRAIFLGYSTLFLGYGGSDPHLEEFLEEMAYFFKGPYKARTYMLLPRAKATPVQVKYKDALGMTVITYDEHSEVTDFLAELRNLNPR